MKQNPLSLRRIRLDPHIRRATREVDLSIEHFMQPLFAVEGLKRPESISGLTGVFRETDQSILKQIETDLKQGVHHFLLFGVPSKKSASKKFRPHSFESTAKSIRDIKKRFGREICLFVDVCLCSYTDHGQCGILNSEQDHVMNSETVETLAMAAKAYADAGADGVAPSDMMDGRIRAIREAIPEKTLLMSYSAKFHSKFYGPFRLAADSAPKGVSKNPYALKDRATYQIDPARPKDAMLSSLRDLEEGADLLMVKPGMPYLDVLKTLSDAIQVPWAVYEVSGEFAAIEVLAEKGLIDREKAHVEAWTAFRRAGASVIISYGSRYAKEWIKLCQ